MIGGIFIDWYNKNKDEFGNVGYFTSKMTRFCGEIKIITVKTSHFYRMKNIDFFLWTDEMIEGLVEESEKKLSDESWRYKNIFDHSQYPQSFECPEGYQFKDENGNVINAMKIVLEKKKKEYPKTYEECLKVLGYDDRETYCICHTGSNERLFESLYRLKVCRDAYWKIAGEEMGLGKPWEPDYDSGVNKYGIICMNGVVQESNPTTNWERHLNKVLDFPTAEMRDAFKENFDPDIEFCKELL